METLYALLSFGQHLHFDLHNMLATMQYHLLKGNNPHTFQEFPDDRGHRDESYQMPSSLPPTSSEVFAPSSQSPKQQQFSTILTRAVSQDGGNHELTSPAVNTPPSGPGQELRCRNSTANANFQNNQLVSTKFKKLNDFLVKIKNPSGVD